MEHSVQLFNFKDQEIRVVSIDGNPYWVITDLCKILEISNVGNATSRLNQKGVRSADILTAGGKQKANVANEYNLYRLIFRSDKPEATAFQDWVFEEVLPAIRKTGGYVGNEEELLKSQLGMMQFAQKVVQKIVDAVSQRYILDNPKLAPYAYIMLCYMRKLFCHAARSYEGAIELLHGKDCIPTIKGDITKIVADIQNGKPTIQLQFPFTEDGKAA